MVLEHYCIYVMKNRRATLPQVAENVSAGHDQAVGKKIERTAVNKSLITKMNAHLRVQW